MGRVIETTLNRAVFLARHLKRCDIACATTAILLELGIPVKGTAFDYIERAVLLIYEDPGRVFTKEIYPMIAASFYPEASRYQVEKVIRAAINEAWKNRDEGIWRIYFAASFDGGIKKPSNCEFIFAIVRFLKLWQGCYRGMYEHDE